MKEDVIKKISENDDRDIIGQFDLNIIGLPESDGKKKKKGRGNTYRRQIRRVTRGKKLV